MPSILVVDNHASIREDLTDFFTTGGWDVTAAANGEEALSAMALRRFDSVVLDLDMPVLDGLSTLRAIRANPAWDDVSIVILTGHGKIESAVAALRQGAYQYLQKPFAYKTLREILISGMVLQKAQALQGELLSGLNIETLFERICTILMTVMRPESLTVLFVDPDGTVRLAKHGKPDGSTVSLDLAVEPRDRPFVESIIRSGLPILEERDASGLGSFLPDARSLAAAAIPAHDGRLAGIIDIETTIANAFDRNWLDALRFYGTLIGISLIINEKSNARAQEEVWRNLPLAARELGHLIKTPLHIIGLQLHSLRTKDLDDPELRAVSPELAGRIRKRAELISEKADEVTSACALLNDITQDLPFHPGRIDLAAMVNKCLTDFRSSCDDNGILLSEWIEPGGPVPLAADSDLIRYTIQCLLCNAREAVLERARLYHTGEWAQDGGRWTASIRVSITIDAAAAQAVLTIVDSGAGIRPENQGRVFQPLFTTKRREGTGQTNNAGIGLFTVKRIMMLHTGRVEFSSQWRDGATFALRFPLLADQAPGEL
ncbi:MAG TPA: hybrid sensor histidine kinase/response regulator [Bryobacteraceae bacterium]|nr:hybrid sensor histidine kinase/response regulator [Bryobacteraceae bacterium]